MRSRVWPVAGAAPTSQLWLPLAGVGPSAWIPVDAPDDERIVADMATGRPWWELRACDIAPWIWRLPVAIRTDKYDRLGWLGRPWDGASDLPVGKQPYDGKGDINEAEPLVDDLDAWDAEVVPSHELKTLFAERLAFMRAFSSDKRLDDILIEAGFADRPDLFLWNLAHGLGSVDPEAPHGVETSEPVRSVMVVEFKKPARRAYGGLKDQIEQQITRYLSQLQGGGDRVFRQHPRQGRQDCVLHCYVVADIVGDLVLQLSGWDTTADGQGRIRRLKGDYRGQIEVVQWQDLVNDAWMKNQATLHAAGLNRRRLTPRSAGRTPRQKWTARQRTEVGGRTRLGWHANLAITASTARPAGCPGRR